MAIFIYFYNMHCNPNFFLNIFFWSFLLCIKDMIQIFWFLKCKKFIFFFLLPFKRTHSLISFLLIYKKDNIYHAFEIPFFKNENNMTKATESTKFMLHRKKYLYFEIYAICKQSYSFLLWISWYYIFLTFPLSFHFIYFSWQYFL